MTLRMLLATIEERLEAGDWRPGKAKLFFTSL
jgi:hypothetical protein